MNLYGPKQLADSIRTVRRNTVLIAEDIHEDDLGTALESSVVELIAEGRLVQLLQDWCPSFPGFYLYYPSRRNRPAALSALIRALRLPG